ncbi:MAG: putative Ig domain-containing protein, partial [Blastocatellia bacterium]
MSCPSSSITVSPSSIPSGSVNAPYAGATFTPGGGTGPYTLSEGGTLPAGITFSSGALSGTPTETGVFPITISATDSSGCSGETNYILAVTCSGTTITFNPGTVNAGTVGTAYTPVSFSPSGGTGSYTTFFAGTLPSGITFSGGTLSGTPTQSGTFSFTLGASDANGCSGSVDYTLTIACQTITVSPGSLPSSPVGTPYPSTVFTQSGGIGTVTFSESGTLPTGLTFNGGTATLSGTPLQGGSFPISVTATDSNGCTGTQSYTLVITCELITVSPNSVASGTAGSLYGPVTFTQTGGLGTVTFSETAILPTGLSLSTGGVLSGTPTQTGSFPISVSATDSNGCTGSVSVTIIINCQAISVNPSTITAGTAGVAYSAAFSQTGGIGTTTFAESGTLPTGITFSGGALSGTPLQTGSFPITVTATDSNGCTGSHGYT